MQGRKAYTLYDMVIERVHNTANAECWIWANCLSDDGYGYVRLSRQKKNKVVHKVAYEERYGPVKEGMELDHTCRNRACWNPDHLEQVTHAVNVKRGVSYWSLQTHCRSGHAFSETNTYFYENPRTGKKQRVCRACSAHRQDAWLSRLV